METNKYIQAMNEAYDDINLKALSPLMEGREQLKLTAYDLNGKELKIISVDYIKYSKKEKDIEHCVILFQEYPDKFYFGGLKLSEWVKGALELVELEEFNEYLLNNPAKVKFDLIRTTSGNPMLDFKLEF